MKWYEDLYTGESIVRKKDRIIRRIKRKRLTLSVYLITFPSNPANLLDIIPSRDLLQKGYPGDDLYIIGLAGGYDEALELVRQIVHETVSNTGACDVVSYLTNKKEIT